MIRGLITSLACLLAIPALAYKADPGDYLVKLGNKEGRGFVSTFANQAGFNVQSLPVNGWVHLKLSESANKKYSMQSLGAMPGVAYIQPNYKLRITSQLNFQKSNPAAPGAIEDMMRQIMAPPLPIPGGGGAITDNPEIPNTVMGGTGADPLYEKQWGMVDNNVRNAWAGTPRGRGIVVAVIDTGVDYTHEDLVNSMWRNPGESGLDAMRRDKATNGVDDDGNGYIDDLIGWDFATNDNKPFDLSVDQIQVL